MQKIIFHSWLGLSLFSGLILNSCGKEEGVLDLTDKIIISFYLPGDTTLESYPVIYQKAEKFILLKGLIEGEKTPQFKCGYTGKIQFMEGEKLLLEGEFNLDSDCRHFAWMEGTEMRTAKMDEPQVQFLKRNAAAARRSQLEKLNWFSGNWRMKGPNGTINESWKLDEQDFLTGQGWELKGKDTTFSEKLSIVCDADGIYYVAEPKNQKPVQFKLTRMRADFVLFENPDHDFPKKIGYEAIGDSGLVGHVQGPAENGEMVTLDFPYKRTE